MKKRKKKPVMMKFAFNRQIDESDVLKITGKGAGVSEKISKTFKTVDIRADKIGNEIAAVLERISSEIKEKSKILTPNKLTISLNCTVASEANIIWLAKGSAEAAIEVTAEWNLNP